MTISYTPIASTTQSSSTLANQAVMNAIKTAITAHPAWTAVDDSTIGTGSYRWLAFKCDKTVSGLPNDYYVLIVWNASTGITVYCGETYNAATHTLTWPCAGVASQGTGALADAVGHYTSTTATYAPAATGAPTATGVSAPSFHSLGQVATTIYYHFAVYDDHLYLATGTTAANMYASGGYVGGFASLLPSPATNDPYPIMVQPWATAAYTSRDLPAFFSTTRYAANQVGVGTGFGGTSAVYAEYGRATNATYDYAQGGYALSRYFLAMISTPVANQNQVSIRGRLSNYLYSVAIPPSLVYGDTLSYGGTQWVCIGNSTGHYIDTGVAG